MGKEVKIKEATMDLKQVNYSFHYSEKLKSNFFLIASVFDRLASLEGERLEGGKEIARNVLRALRNELNLAKQHLPANEVSNIEGKLMDASGEMELRNYGKAREKFAEALSRVTTLSDKYMQDLRQAEWI